MPLRPAWRELYEYAVARFETVLQKHTTRSSIGFAGSFNGSRKTVISLLPGDSDAEEGLRYRLYKNRFAELAKLPSADVEAVMPQHHEDWTYVASGGPDWEGFEGFVTGHEEIDRLARALSRVAHLESTGP